VPGEDFNSIEIAWTLAATDGEYLLRFEFPPTLIFSNAFTGRTNTYATGPSTMTLRVYMINHADNVGARTLNVLFEVNGVWDAP
jgi:hypothetical protein